MLEKGSLSRYHLLWKGVWDRSASGYRGWGALE